MDKLHRPHNSIPFTSGANENTNFIDVDSIMVIPDTPDRTCKNEDICEGSSVSPRYNSRIFRRANKANLGRRFQPFGSHPKDDIDCTDQIQCTGGPSAQSVFRNHSTSNTDKNLKFKGKHNCNHQDVIGGKFSHSGFPETSHHHHNRSDLPVFDHGVIANGLKKVAYLHSPGTSFRSTVNDDKRKMKFGKDNLVKGNGEVVHVDSEHGTEEGLSVPARAPNPTIRKRLVRNGCISPHDIAKAKTSIHSNHQNVEEAKFLHFRPPGISHHYHNSHGVPLFDHGDTDTENCSKDDVYRNDDKGKGKGKVGNDNDVHSEAILAKGNDDIFHIALEHCTGEGISMPSVSVRAPNAVRKMLVRNGCISPLNIAKAKTASECTAVRSAYAECNATSGGSKNIIDVDKVNVASEHGTEEGLSVPVRAPNPTIRKRLVRNGCISPHDIAKAKTSIHSNHQNVEEAKFSHFRPPGISHHYHNSHGVPLFDHGDTDTANCSKDDVYRNDDKGKGKVGNDNDVHSEAILAKGNDENFHIALEHCTGEGISMPSVSVRAPNAVRKMLVRNGCISPLNIAKAKTASECTAVSSAYAECNATSGGSKNIIDVDKVIAKENAGNRSKGKGVLIPSSLNGHEDRRFHTGRFADARRNDSSKSVVGNSVSTSAPSALKLVPGLSDGEVGTRNSSKRKKVAGSSSSTHGEKREIIYLSSGGNSSATKSIMEHRGRPRRPLNSSIVMRNITPDMVECDRQIDNDNDTRAIQLEVDELMARELQEQLYNEMPEATNGERVSELAREVSRGLVSVRGRRRAHADMPARSSNARRVSHNPFLRNRPLRRGTHARIPSSSFTRLRTRTNRHPSMGSGGSLLSDADIDMRLELLEALEAVGDDDIRSINNLLSIPEFGENDYEMLLALDDNNHEHLGASATRIASLPESTVHSESTEVCSICLETPAVGDTVRHLPCFHKFHKDCIDPWLRRKRSCPVCKSDV